MHNGSYLTIEDDDKTRKFVLRVEDSVQLDAYHPSPLIVDMDLSPLAQDQKSQNLILASRIVEYPEREDGRSSFIRPQSIARISNQEEVDIAFENTKGIPIFPATVFARTSQHLRDRDGRFIQVKIPEDVFFHQMLITGSTGSGKTVAMKYLSQYFVERLDLGGQGPGAVLAVNVKEEDLLSMDRPSTTQSKEVRAEWSDLGLEPHGIETFRIYYPGNQNARYSNSVNNELCRRITIRTENVEPEALSGLIQNISDLGADQLPSIFRFWKNRLMKDGEKLTDFITYFNDPMKKLLYKTMNTRGEELEIRLFPGTQKSLLNALTYATEYFDLEDAEELGYGEILQHGKISIIDVNARYGFEFGSVLLRDLLVRIYEAKSQRLNDVPVLIVIDEVHEFYGSTRSREALRTLDAICRKGRSLRIGVIFASQNPQDMPKGITSVVNTRIDFKSDSIRECDPEALKKGYCLAKVHGLGQLKFAKFPLSLGGVNDAGGTNR